ncbi:hypothetical protein LMI01_06810 [Companilactobacillus mindensis]|nr:hypothetical protein LMI01_06810 [Companilactobacillus mindensis]
MFHIQPRAEIRISVDSDHSFLKIIITFTYYETYSIFAQAIIVKGLTTPNKVIFAILITNNCREKWGKADEFLFVQIFRGS